MTISLDEDALTRNLRETNCRLVFWLDTLDPAICSRPAATSEQMGGLLTELLRAGEWLRGGLSPAQQSDLELTSELAQYRRNVERLRDLLPLIHQALLLERSSLERRRSRMEAATRWAQASRQTLQRR